MGLTNTKGLEFLVYFSEVLLIIQIVGYFSSMYLYMTLSSEKVGEQAFSM